MLIGTWIDTGISSIESVFLLCYQNHNRMPILWYFSMSLSGRWGHVAQSKMGTSGQAVFKNLKQLGREPFLFSPVLSCCLCNGRSSTTSGTKRWPQFIALSGGGKRSKGLSPWLILTYSPALHPTGLLLQERINLYVHGPLVLSSWLIQSYHWGLWHTSSHLPWNTSNIFVPLWWTSLLVWQINKFTQI